MELVTSTYSKRDAVILVLSAIFFVVFGVMLAYCGVKQWWMAVSTAVLFIEILIFVTAFFSLATAVLIVRGLFTKVHADEQGLRLSRHEKCLIAIDWNDIVEVDTGFVHNARTKKPVVYFARKPLSEECREDVTFAHTDAIYFRSLSPEWLAFLQAHCPLPIPERPLPIPEQ